VTTAGRSTTHRSLSLPRGATAGRSGDQTLAIVPKRQRCGLVADFRFDRIACKEPASTWGPTCSDSVLSRPPRESARRAAANLKAGPVPEPRRASHSGTLTATRGGEGWPVCSLRTRSLHVRVGEIVAFFDLSGGLADPDSTTRSRHAAYYFASLLMRDGARLIAADSLTRGVLCGW
jgi:hypothetical protein